MAGCPSPITAENFQAAWKCVARKRRWSVKKELIRRVSVTLAQLVYFFVFVILAIGIFYEMGGPFVRRYMDVLPQVGIWWRQISEPILEGASGEVMRILRCLGIVYLVPFAAALVVAVPIALLYHPLMQKQTGDHKQDARQLRVMAKHAQIYAQKKENNTESICAVFIGVLMVVFVLGLMLFAYNNPSLREQVMMKAHQANWTCFLYGLVLFVCYRLLNVPLKLLLKLLHYCRVPASMVADTEHYHSELCREESAADEAKEEFDASAT